MGYEGCEIGGGYIRGGIPEEIKQEELIPEIQQRKYQQPYVYVENNPVNEIDPGGLKEATTCQDKCNKESKRCVKECIKKFKGFKNIAKKILCIECCTNKAMTICESNCLDDPCYEPGPEFKLCYTKIK